jgi:cytochrome c551/c552
MYLRNPYLRARADVKHAILHLAGVTSLAALLMSCSDSGGEPNAVPCQSRAQVPCTCADGSPGLSTCSASGSGVGVCQCQAGLGGGGGTGSSGASASGGTGSAMAGLPCDVKAIIERQCVACHAREPKFGAPMPLVSAMDFRVAAPGAASVGQRVLARIADDQRPMPPPPNERVSSADRLVLERWIESGALDGSCGSEGLETGSGGTGEMPRPQPADVTCYELTARASAAGDKYSVPTTPDLYQCFEYAAPWGDKKVQVVSARPIIDNDKVLHHWNLYNVADAVHDGANGSCFGAHPNAALVAGWAPGGNGLELEDDVGLHTEAGGFSLEMHYNNKVGAGQLDASGAEVCVTEKLRPKEAGVHWLGTQNLNKLSATGTCAPINPGPVTILSSSPHMHLQGRHLKTVINRKDGGSEVLIDQPFDFNTQISYPTPAVINPGDTLSTTCTFATPTPFGQGTNEEMCYNFVLAYPAGHLAQLLQLLRKNDCTGL